MADGKTGWMGEVPVPDYLARELLNECYAMALPTNGDEDHGSRRVFRGRLQWHF